MKSLNTVVALASFYAPIVVSTAAVASQNDALIGIEPEALISQYCVPRGDNLFAPKLYCDDGRG